MQQPSFASSSSFVKLEDATPRELCFPFSAPDYLCLATTPTTEFGSTVLGTAPPATSKPYAKPQAGQVGKLGFVQQAG